MPSRREAANARPARDGDRLTEEAVFGLARRFPELSARRVASRGQIAALSLAVLAFAILLWRWPHATLHAFVAAMSVLFVFGMAFRAFLAWYGAHATAEAPPPAEPGELPRYTILVPLYREAAVVPDWCERSARSTIRASGCRSS